jgi:3-hydroxyisobutyrate dehydrogenase
MRRVAVLGTGTMGAGMARSMLRVGLDVTAWNRSPDRAAPLAADGARVAGTAAEAVAGVDAVVTMLWDAGSVAEVMAGALPAAPEGVLWAQTSTVGVRDAGERLPALAAEYGARYLDAPVLGTRQPAEEGKLIVLAAAPEPLRDPIAPLLDAIGTRTVWVSERPGDGTRLKLVANSWAATLVAAAGQAIALAQGLGLDPRLFLDMIRGSAMDAGYLQLKGQAMIAGEFPPAFTVRGAIKDTGLIAAAMRDTGTDAALMDAVWGQFGKAADSGYGEQDMAAVFCAFRPRHDGRTDDGTPGTGEADGGGHGS